MAMTAAQLLDELMGRDRNLIPGEKSTQVHWSHVDVCKHFLCGFCANDLFVNTKADLGPCNKVHDEVLKQEYEKSSRYGKMGFEEDFVRYLHAIQADVDRKIRRGHERLLMNKVREQELAENDSDKTKMLTDHINQLLEEIEQLGSEGKVEEAQGVARLVEQLKEEREQSKSSSGMAGQEKQMEVCEVCGAFLIVGDAQARVDDHLQGKQHVGYAKIKSTIEDLKDRPWLRLARVKEKEKEIKRKEEDRDRDRDKRSRSRRSSRDRSREKRRRSRSRSRDRHRERRRSRERSDKRYSNERDRERRRSRDRDRDRHRDRDSRRSGHRSRSRSPRERSRKRSRSTEREEKSSSRHSSRDRRDRDRDRDYEHGHHHDHERDRDNERDHDRERSCRYKRSEPEEARSIEAPENGEDLSEKVEQLSKYEVMESDNNIGERFSAHQETKEFQVLEDMHTQVVDGSTNRENFTAEDIEEVNLGSEKMMQQLENKDNSLDIYGDNVYQSYNVLENDNQTNGEYVDESEVASGLPQVGSYTIPNHIQLGFEGNEDH